MNKQLLILMCVCVALASAAPGLLHATPILTNTYHTLPTLHVVRPIYHALPSFGHSNYGYGHGHGHGYGHAHGWL
ncbi:maker697 [Drosophila busckii]|uniref:Maker697 n=1 Tax=Drosophila busckii TaxID=30019 RepID=A0A0M4E9V2_DROBS|nr:homeotic protein female sterile [Drosophila busckii]ALC43941.1 maker697 [Drosophila busckii]